MAVFLIADDNKTAADTLCTLVKRRGHEALAAYDGAQALEVLENRAVDVLVTDLKMPNLDGMQLLRIVQEKWPEMPVIVITAHGSIEAAVEAMKIGAFDFMTKPLDNNELQVKFQKAVAQREMSLKMERLSARLDTYEADDAYRYGMGEIIGTGPAMKKVYEIIKKVAPTDSTVLILGESGTGKELVARAMHQESGRSDNPFVVINCGGIPETLMESELFGHKKGSFTGATHDKKGLFEVADKGTVFLDEIGELSLPIQVKLLRAIQERTFKPVGSSEDLSVDIRIVAATNKQLEKEVIAGNFREDLFYRLNVIEIKMPPLRERKGDLRPLAQHFLDKYCREMGKKISKMSSYAINMLNKYDFPGNIRELENLLERSVALSTTNILLPDSLALSIHKRRWIEGVKDRRFDVDEVARGVSLDNIIEEIERAYLLKALEVANGNKNKAAELLGISFRSLRYRLDKLGSN